MVRCVVEFPRHWPWVQEIQPDTVARSIYAPPNAYFRDRKKRSTKKRAVLDFSKQNLEKRTRKGRPFIYEKDELFASSKNPALFLVSLDDVLVSFFTAIKVTGF